MFCGLVWWCVLLSIQCFQLLLIFDAWEFVSVIASSRHAFQCRAMNFPWPILDHLDCTDLDLRKRRCHYLYVAVFIGDIDIVKIKLRSSENLRTQKTFQYRVYP